MQVYSGQGNERLVTATASTSDGNGAITFRVGPCPLGFVWKGSVTVIGAPSGALFTSSVATTPWGQWAGATNFGPVQLWGNETLIVVGGGLQPNTQYSMTFFGVAMPEFMAEPVPPVAPLSTVSVETTTLLVNGLAFTGPFVVTPPSLTRRMTIVASSTSAAVGLGVYTVTGNTTGAVYGTFRVTHPIGSVATPQYIAIEPSIDATYTINFSTGTNGSLNIWVLTSFNNPLETSNPSSPILVLPAFGQINAQADVALAANTTNQGLIGAPGAGRSIVLQQVVCYALGANGPVGFAFHSAGSTNMIGRCIVSSTGTDQILWEGGFEMPANTQLQVDTSLATTAALIIADVTYIAGPTV